MARTIDEFGNESGSIVERKEKKKQELAEYTIEDKKNVINFHKSGRKTPKQYELESLQRQYGKKV